RDSVVRDIQMIQVNGEVVLGRVAIQLEVNDHSMPIARDGTVGHADGGGHTIQSNRIVDHLVVAGRAEIDDQMVPLATYGLARNVRVYPALGGIVPNRPEAIPSRTALRAKHHGASRNV